MRSVSKTVKVHKYHTRLHNYGNSSAVRCGGMLLQGHTVSKSVIYYVSIYVNKELTKISPRQATNSVAYPLSGSVLVYRTGTLTVVRLIRRPINILGYSCKVTGICHAKIV